MLLAQSDLLYVVMNARYMETVSDGDKEQASRESSHIIRIKRYIHINSRDRQNAREKKVLGKKLCFAIWNSSWMCVCVRNGWIGCLVKPKRPICAILSGWISVYVSYRKLNNIRLLALKMRWSDVIEISSMILLMKYILFRKYCMVDSLTVEHIHTHTKKLSGWHRGDG